MAGLVDYANKTVVITGASSGIGAEFGRQLARRRTRVALIARRRDRLEQVAQEIAKAGGESSVHVCDVSQRPQVEQTCRDVIGRWGGIDLLINNAGYGRHILVQDQEVEDFERMMQTNYLGAVYWMKSVLPAMRARGQGWIVNISSLAGAMPQPDEAAYSATKFALSALSESLAYEVAPHGIHVMVVHPALVRTEMFTPEIMARLPSSAARAFIEPDAFVAATLRALARGEISIIVPRRFRAITLLRALSPRVIGGALARIKLRAVPGALS